MKASHGRLPFPHWVEPCAQLCGRDVKIRITHHRGHHPPIWLRIEHDPHPSARPDVGGPKEAIGVDIDERVERAGGLWQPDGEVSGSV
jgi:hypothetical protein